MTRAEDLLAILREVIGEALSGEKAVALSYSGGLDSSVAGALAAEVSDVRAYCCTTEGSFDASHVERFAEDEGLNLTVLRLDSQEVRRYVVRTVSVLGTPAPVPIAYTIPIVCVIDRCQEPAVVSGSGADELFGGYAKYASMPEPEKAMAEDLVKMRTEHSLMDSYARKSGRRLVSPFVSDALTAFASALPMETKLTKDDRKIVLRDVAKLLGLRSSARAKKAAQYSSGILKEMERQAKAQGVGLQEWVLRQAEEGS